MQDFGGCAWFDNLICACAYATNWWVWFNWPLFKGRCVVNPGQGLCPLSGVERCPFLGGCKCYSKINRGHGI